jgi:hypothetical protein
MDESRTAIPMATNLLCAGIFSSFAIYDPEGISVIVIGLSFLAKLQQLRVNCSDIQ